MLSTTSTFVLVPSPSQRYSYHLPLLEQHAHYILLTTPLHLLISMTNSVTGHTNVSLGSLVIVLCTLKRIVIRSVFRYLQHILVSGNIGIVRKIGLASKRVNLRTRVLCCFSKRVSILS